MTDARLPLSHSCPSCAAADALPVATCPQVPLFCNVLLSSPEAARSVARGDLQLVACRRCGLLYNSQFDPQRVLYSPEYENSQRHSPRFASFLTELAERLVATYRLQNARVVEVGCGDGHFLRQVCHLGNNHGLGFDPAVDQASESDNVRIEDRLFHASELSGTADMICSRHVLEHLHEPRELLGDARDALSDQGVAYFEVPNAWLTVTGIGLWDLLYEHCLYFTEPALAHLFQSCGFAVRDIRTAFDKQFLSIEAEASRHSPSEDLWNGVLRVDEVLAAAASCGERFTQLIQYWSDRARDWTVAGRRFVLWGAGTKGVMFLNLVDHAAAAAGIVDLNPRKHGCYIAGTGHPILPPAELRAVRPDIVLIMNSAYRNEIKQMLRELRIDAEVVAIGDEDLQQVCGQAA